MASSASPAARSATRSRRRPPIVDLRSLGRVVGVLIIILAIAMLPPLAVDFFTGNPDWQAFLVASGGSAFVGITLLLANRSPYPAEIGTRDAFLLTTMAWLAVAVVGALPFAISELEMSLADAFFESMSGITTTGSTVMSGLDDAPPGILLWRAMLQWLGGIGIIVMAVAVLPALRVGGMQLFRSENSDRSEKILPRAAQIASAIGSVYAILTLTCAILYWMVGLSVFDATAHAMTTIATGGYSTSDASISLFQDARVEWVAIVFMLAGGIPFVLYVHALRGRPGFLLQDVQVLWFLSLVLIVSVALTIWLVASGLLSGHDAYRHALFTTVSLITGTGYASTDYGQWGAFAIAVLFFITCFGGCTGSTTGGLKMFRFIVLYQVARLQVLRLIRPNGVVQMKLNGRLISDEAAVSVMAFVFLFALAFAVIALLLGMLGLDFLTAMSASLTSLANVGPGLGQTIGPAGNFASLPEAAKWLLSFAMLLGRLEIFTVLLILLPAFWRS